MNKKDFLQLQNETSGTCSLSPPRPICQDESRHFSSAGLKRGARVSKRNSVSFSCFCFRSLLHSSVSEQSSLFEYQPNPKLRQFTAVLCKVKTVQRHRYRTPPLPPNSSSHGYYICDRKQLPPPPPSPSAGRVMGDIFWHICLPFKQDLI